MPIAVDTAVLLWRGVWATVASIFAARAGVAEAQRWSPLGVEAVQRGCSAVST